MPSRSASYRLSASDADHLLDASRVFSAAIALSLEGAEGTLTLPQLRALVLLSRRGALNVTGLAEALGVDRSNASRVCDQLENRGLVRRETADGDRRNVVLEVTPEGTRLVSELLRRRQIVLEQVMASMQPDERDQLIAALAAFVQAAGRLGAEGQALSDGDGHLLRWLG